LTFLLFHQPQPASAGCLLLCGEIGLCRFGVGRDAGLLVAGIYHAAARADNLAVFFPQGGFVVEEVHAKLESDAKRRVRFIPQKRENLPKKLEVIS
jgi:hypothetical protein